jgi:hypothetical protein
MRSLVRVELHDKITPKDGKDRSVTKEHSWGLKRKRPNFMQEDPLSWTWGWSRQNDVIGGGKVQNAKRTHGSEGATKPGRDGPGPVGLAHFHGGSPPISWAWRWCNPKYVWAPPFAEEEPFARDVVHKLERKERREIIREKDRSSPRKQPQVEEDVEALPRHPGGEGRHRRKRHHDQQRHV